MFDAHLRRTIVIILTCSLFIGIFDAAAQDTPGVNDPPVNSLPGSVNTEPNTPVAIAASVSDPDVGSGNMEVELAVSFVGGSVTCGGTFSWGGGSGLSSDTMTDTLANVNAALSTLTFTPQAGCVGMARLVLETDDQGNTWGTPCPHLPANPQNCILADTNFININILAVLPTATSTATATNTTVPNTATATNTVDPAVPTNTATATNTVDPAAPSATLQAVLTLTPVVEPCLYYIPNGAVQGRMVTSVRAFFAPNFQSETPDVVIPGGSTWYIVGASNGFYQLFIACPGNLVWVPASSMIPNYDEVWNGAPLPNAGG